MPGTLYLIEHTRTLVPKALVKFYNLDYEIINDQQQLLQDFPLGRVPALIDASGFKMTETIAISIRLAREGKPNNSLLGKTDDEFDQILSWSSFGNAELMNFINAAKAGSADGFKGLSLCADILENHLRDRDYLVGDELTLADLLIVQYLRKAFLFWFGQEQRDKFPKLTKWWHTIVSSDILKNEFDDFKLIA